VNQPGRRAESASAAWGSPAVGTPRPVFRGLTITALVGALLAILGCGSAQYLFQPTVDVPVTSAERPEALYRIPPQSPRGNLYVASLGLIRADLAQTGRDVPLLHLRLTVSNDSDAGPWTVDAREQLVAIPGAGQSRPALVNSDQPGAPNLTVPPHQTKVIDLYYALPPDISSAADVSAFDLLWHVQTPALMVADHTPYSRVRLPSPQATASTSVALGLAHWWYDPLYPALTFNPPPIVLHEKFPALVKQPPHPRLIVGDGRDHH